MGQSANILAAAEQIRPHLPTLLDSETARVVDGEIAALLTQARAGTKVDNKLLAAMSRHESTREWMAQFFSSLLTESSKGSYQPQAGPINLLEMADVFRCPQGDYTWYRHSIGEEIPVCPTHFVELVKVN